MIACPQYFAGSRPFWSGRGGLRFWRRRISDKIPPLFTTNRNPFIVHEHILACDGHTMTIKQGIAMRFIPALLEREAAVTSVIGASVFNIGDLLTTIAALSMGHFAETNAFPAAIIATWGLAGFTAWKVICGTGLVLVAFGLGEWAAARGFRGFRLAQLPLFVAGAILVTWNLSNILLLILQSSMVGIP